MKKILVLGNYTDAMYHPLACVDERLKQIYAEGEFTFTEDPNMLLDSINYDLVVSYWDDWNNAIPEAAAKALLKYVEAGGVLLGIHNGISLQLNDEIRVMFGGKFLYHPEQEVIKIKCAQISELLTDSNVQTADLNSETIAELNDPKGIYFEVKEEPYQYELYDDDKQIFMTYEYQGKTYPGGWYKTYGEGRVVYVMPGHTYEKFDIPEYREILKMCFEFCF